MQGQWDQRQRPNRAWYALPETGHAARPGQATKFDNCARQGRVKKNEVTQPAQQARRRYATVRRLPSVTFTRGLPHHEDNDGFARTIALRPHDYRDPRPPPHRPRISAPAAPPRQLTVADVTLDFGTRTVRRDGQLVDLTGVEFDLLALLLRDAGQIVSREILAKQVLGREFSPFDRSIDMHISNLRRKLGSQLNGIERLKAIRGVGYIYAAPSQL